MEKRVKSQALEKFVHNKRAVFGVIVVLVIALCCLLLPLVMFSGSVHHRRACGL